MKEMKWLGSTECDMCKSMGAQNATIKGKKLYDSATVYGSWATMCRNCFQTYGAYKLSQLGLGKGQEYTRNDKGDFIKTRG